MKWEEFGKQRKLIDLYNTNRQPTDIECPMCGKKVYVRTDIVFASYPPQNKYECDCGWVGYH